MGGCLLVLGLGNWLLILQTANKPEIGIWQHTVQLALEHSCSLFYTDENCTTRTCASSIVTCGSARPAIPTKRAPCQNVVI
uniref:Putative secreted peptide n=1 Tax=Anopheles braziliensis TaxID=58242 RepID=A0A2M3ZQA5_9DIPT